MEKTIKMLKENENTIKSTIADLVNDIIDIKNGNVDNLRYSEKEIYSIYRERASLMDVQVELLRYYVKLLKSEKRLAA